MGEKSCSLNIPCSFTQEAVFFIEMCNHKINVIQKEDYSAQI